MSMRFAIRRYDFILTLRRDDVFMTQRPDDSMNSIISSVNR